MAQAIKREHGLDTELIGGHGGILDITLDGEIVFSKHKAGYKCEPAEAVKLVGEKLQAAAG